MKKLNENTINKKSDKEFYEELSGKKLTDQEVFEANSNFVGFFDLLLKIDQRTNDKSKKSKKVNRR